MAGVAWRPYLGVLSVVVLSGDSSPDALKTMKAAAQQVFDPCMGPGYMRDIIDPGDVIAVGAAIRAKYVLDSGNDFFLFGGWKSFSKDESHPKSQTSITS